MKVKYKKLSDLPMNKQQGKPFIDLENVMQYSIEILESVKKELSRCAGDVKREMKDRNPFQYPGSIADIDGIENYMESPKMVLADLENKIKVVNEELKRREGRRKNGKTGETSMGTVSITRADYPPLIQPIPINVKRVDNKDGTIRWEGENDNLSMRECVSVPVFPRWKWLAKRKLKKRAIMTLDFLVDYYIIQGNDNVTPLLRMVIERLRNVVTISRRREKWHWEEEQRSRDECHDAITR